MEAFALPDGVAYISSVLKGIAHSCREEEPREEELCTFSGTGAVPGVESDPRRGSLAGVV